MARTNRFHHALFPLGAGLAMLCGALVGCDAMPGARGDVTSIFAVINPTTPQEAAMMAVDPFNADNRQKGLLMLANAPWGGEQVYLDLYRMAITDDDNGVRMSAVKALALHGGPEDVPRILPFLNSEDRILRLEATRALERLHNPIAIVPLIERVDRRRERVADVRASAATALGQYATQRVLDALIGALDDENLWVNLAAERSLRLLTGQEDFGLDVVEWVSWTRTVDDPFADRKPFQYPVFRRDRNFIEIVLPFIQPPNEIAAAPAGMPPIESSRTN